jgi:hypothetical protein
MGEDSRRLGNRHRVKEVAGWAEMGPGQLAQPISRPRPAGPAHFEAQSTPFDLDGIQAIYSPEARRHTSIHSPSAAEEQRREGHHLGEERVELVD